MNAIIAGMFISIGVSLCLAGFSEKGLPVSRGKRITGPTAKILGILALALCIGCLFFFSYFQREMADLEATTHRISSQAH